ncbi:MAG: HDOD domain-containing protein [Woeseiaceae bacterium]|nr:HDOD domain-containing protein [Woeseiaceae bacterium]
MHANANMNQTASHIVKSLAALPPLPAAAAEILAQFGDEFIEARTVTQIVERDPGICAKLLGLANSAFFNLAEPVTRMEEVISRVLGVDTVRSLVFAMALQKSFDHTRCPAFDPQKFWLDSLCVAESCKRLARSDDNASESLVNLSYPAGLCHNLGLMALAHIEAERTDRVLQAHADYPRPCGLAPRLVEEFNTDHRHTTAELAKLWSLPEVIVSAYEHRTSSAADGAENHLAAMLDASVATIGNRTGPDESWVDLDGTARRLGLTADQLTELAEPNDRQLDRLRSVASSMKA